MRVVSQRSSEEQKQQFAASQNTKLMKGQDTHTVYTHRAIHNDIGLPAKQVSFANG
jgi:hypothetical protein